MDNPYKDAIQPFGNTEDNPIIPAPELPIPAAPRGLAREQLSASVFEEQLNQYRADCARREPSKIEDPWFWAEPLLTASFAATVGSVLTARIPLLRPTVLGLFGVAGGYYALGNQTMRRDSADLNCIIGRARSDRR